MRPVEMAVILKRTVSNIFYCILIIIGNNTLWNLKSKFHSKAASQRVHNKTVLVQIMAWCRIGKKSLPEPMMVVFAAAYMRHSASLSYKYNDFHLRKYVCRMSAILFRSQCVMSKYFSVDMGNIQNPKSHWRHKFVNPVVLLTCVMLNAVS